MSEKEPKNPKAPKPSASKSVKKDTPVASKQKATVPPPAKTAAKTEAKPQAKAEPKKTTAKVAQDADKTVKPKKTETKTSKTQKPEKSGEKRSFGTRVADTFHTATEKVKGGAAVIAHNKKARAGAIAGLAAILILCLVLGLVFGLRGCSRNSTFTAEAINAYPNVTKVNYSAEIIGKVNRTPQTETKNEGAIFGNEQYPTYGSTLKAVIGTDDDKVAARQKLIDESSYLCAFGTSGANRGIPSGVDRNEYIKTKYTCMDKEGWLYYMNDGTDTLVGNGEKTHSVDENGDHRRLYKHTAAVGMYLGNVSDTEPGIVKRITLMHRTNGYSVTGVYAPAGEVLKVEISGKDMNAEGRIRINIGQALYNNQANNIWASKNQMQRIPHVLTTLEINKYTAEYDASRDVWTGYIGSFVGGPVYVQNTTNTVNLTISGGVRYSHFILGYTTPEEYAENAKSSAPYFDLEVWDCGVLHSGPKTYAKSFSYDDLYKAAVLWEKVSIVTNTNHYKQGIVFIYDPFVAAGAAVAFPGRSSVNCPTGWMSQSLNYNSLTTSGSWGNFHEYHHNFQNYGVGYTGEVTNNGLNLVSYALFTNISASRQIASYGGAGLSGWNCYTSAPWALQRVNANQITDTNGLAVYSTLLHNLGADAFIQSRGATGAAYFNKYADKTHQDFSYYAGLVQTYSNIAPSALASTDYPLFVPVSSVYQTGRTYTCDDKTREINTMQPYVIPYGVPFTVDLRPYKTIIGSNGEDTQQYESGSVIIAKDFNYTIKSVNAKGAKGTFIETDTKGVYTFTPNSEMRSGKIYVTLEITTKDGAHEWNGHRLDDVDLVLEFQQSKEWNKNVLERTVYTYSADDMYTDAQTAFENNFAGSSSSQTVDHSNLKQDSNTDIWLYPNAEEKNAPDYYYVSDNRIDVIDGKLYFKEDGKYRVYLRGRLNCALYFSIDGNKYDLGATIKKTASFANSDKFATFASDPNTYFDVEFTEGKCTVWVNAGDGKTLEFKHSGDNWLYLKEILIVQSSPVVSYIGVGYAQWTVPMYTAEVKYYIGSEDNKTYVTEEVVDGVTKYYSGPANNKTYVDNDLVRSETVYKNSSGQVVSAEQANDTAPKEPKAASYVTAYRSNYEFKQEFVSDYFYIKEYKFNYTDNVWQNKTTEEQQQTLVSTNYISGIASWNANSFKTEYIVDGRRDTYIHSKNKITENKPLEFIIDMGEVKSVNRMDVYTQYRPNGDYHIPKDFILYGSVDGTDFFTVSEVIDAQRNGTLIRVDFDEISFRYYKLVITRSDNLCIIGEIEMWRALEINDGTQYSPDRDMFKYSGSWKLESGASSFGHVFTGKKGSTVEFEFEGIRLGILTSAAHKNDYEVYIDGKKVDSIVLKDDSGMTTVTYISPELKDGKHKVEIKCKGDVGFDSVVIWRLPEYKL